MSQNSSEAILGENKGGSQVNFNVITYIEPLGK